MGRKKANWENVNKLEQENEHGVDGSQKRMTQKKVMSFNLTRTTKEKCLKKE